MDWLEVLARIENGEDERTEFKRGLGDLKPVGRTVAAFANSDGGLLILGVDDSGTIVGVAEGPESAQERLTGFLQSGLGTPVQARIGRHQERGRWVLWIEVPRQRNFEPLRHEGRVFLRRGRASVEPSPSELQELFNIYGYILTEERAIDAAHVEAIDLQAFRDFLGALGLDLSTEPKLAIEDDLKNRGVLIEIGGELRATLYGVLAFGRMPQSYPQTQNFWIQCAAYMGKDRAGQVLQVAEGKGRLDEQVDRAVGWVRGLGWFERYSGLHRTDIQHVPQAALREALVNAAAHRDYAIMGSKIQLEVFEDRLDVTSPGRLPNGITVRSVISGGNPRSRNQSIANFFMAQRKMEQRGRGWLVMRKAMLEHNGTEPELYEDRDARWVRVSLRLGPPPALGDPDR